MAKPTRTVSEIDSDSAMQMNRCRHLVPLYPYHATNYNYYNLITFNCVLWSVSGSSQVCSPIKHNFLLEEIRSSTEIVKSWLRDVLFGCRLTMFALVMWHLLDSQFLDRHSNPNPDPNPNPIPNPVQELTWYRLRYMLASVLFCADTVFTDLLTDQFELELSLLILVCIHKSYIVYLEIYVVHPILYLLMSWVWWDWPLTWLTKTIVLQCYDTVGWVVWPMQSFPKWVIMCRVGCYKLYYTILSILSVIKCTANSLLITDYYSVM